MSSAHEFETGKNACPTLETGKNACPTFTFEACPQFCACP